MSAGRRRLLPPLMMALVFGGSMLAVQPAQVRATTSAPTELATGTLSTTTSTVWTGLVRAKASIVRSLVGPDGTHHLLMAAYPTNWAVYANDAHGAWHFSELQGVAWDMALDSAGNAVVVTQSPSFVVHMPVTVYTQLNGAWVSHGIPGNENASDASVAVAGNGDIHVAWAVDKHVLHYAVRTSSGWVPEVAVAPADVPDMGFPGYFGNMDLALDGTGKPHIFMSGHIGDGALKTSCDDLNGCLVDISPNGVGVWTIAPIGGIVCRIAVITNPSGSPVLTCARDIDVRYFEHSGPGWVGQVVATLNPYQANPAWTSSGPVVFLSSQQGTKRLDRVSGTWVVKETTTLNAVVVGALDALGRTHIAFHQNLSVGGGFEPSVSLRAPDAVPPVVAGPISKPRAGSVIGTTVPSTVSWSASDTLSGLDHYQLQQKIATAAWTTVSSTFTTTSTIRNLTPNLVYQFRVRGWDKAGNVSPLAYGTAFKVIRNEGTSSLIKYTGTWSTQTTTTASGGSTRYSTSKGAYATITLNGSSFAWVSPKGPTRGTAQVWVDGVHVIDVSLYKSTTTNKAIVYSIRWPTVGSHVVKLVVSGTSGHPRIDLDAFLVTR